MQSVWARCAMVMVIIRILVMKRGRASDTDAWPLPKQNIDVGCIGGNKLLQWNFLCYKI